ncbi:methyltransferase domain-containing protein [Mesorhizobium sp. B2-7-3]|uniref:methyltransferase domain-containing protein n=1 Tax=Mesorhizobium sp. B2-7-3 TaxID=2589907 RepID=UPI0011285183|nr:methyltransferase domain-containing protein [Mesorhizobium sp. B2-7-3]TPJ08996.1 methyltransferase domain-containing protein [Mesorhizobium sp. B2-7-3]
MKNFDDLYKAFEDRFRGSRELVKGRLEIYQPLLAQVPRQPEGPTLAIDLGCGRGEWLEILTEAGLEAVGVDLNGGMAQEAIERGLRIELRDAIEYLREQPDETAAVISAFHMVEHVPTDYLIELLNECRRVLAEDGLLILETPNPENISVGTHTFYLDPTHKSPLPPSLLEFLVEQVGFPEIAILRLNGSPMIKAGPIERSIHLMFEVGRDYACLARKQGMQSEGKTGSLAAFVQAASQQVPTDMAKIKGWLHSADEEIVNSSDGGATSSNALQFQQLTENLAAQSELMQAGNKALTDTVASIGKQLRDVIKDRAVAARDAEIARLQQQMAETDAVSTEQLTGRQAAIEERDAEIARLQKLMANMEAATSRQVAERDAEIARLNKSVTKLAEQVQPLAVLVDAFQNSTSWRITAPMRGLIGGASAVARIPKVNAKLLMQHGLLWLRRRPRASVFVQRLIRFAPLLERRLLGFARSSSGLVPIDTGWKLDPDPAVLDAWRRRLRAGK